jgi:hypothetical protein
MKTIVTRQEMQIRAAETLRAVLAEVSGARIREIRPASHGAASASSFTASVDVYGRSETIACEITQDAQPAHVRAALAELQSSIKSSVDAVVPLIIAPHLSDEARDLCRESKTGFLDLEGNARIALGEVFILKRNIPHPQKHAAAHQSARHTTHNTAA